MRQFPLKIKQNAIDLFMPPLNGNCCSNLLLQKKYIIIVNRLESTISIRLFI